MALNNSRRVSALIFISIFLLQMVLINDQIKPVKASKKILLKLKALGALLFLLKHKKPKFGILPVPLPLPIPLKVEKPHHKVIVHKAKPEHIAIAEPMHEPWPEHW